MKVSVRRPDHSREHGRHALDALLGRAGHGQGVDLFFDQRVRHRDFVFWRLLLGSDIDDGSGSPRANQLDVDHVVAFDQLDRLGLDRKELGVRDREPVLSAAAQVEAKRPALVSLCLGRLAGTSDNFDDDSGLPDRILASIQD